MKIFSLFILCFSWLEILACPNADSINVIRQTDLVFYSDFEQAAFEIMSVTASTDYMKIALANDPDMTAAKFENINNAFDGALQRIKNHKKFSKPPKKQVRFVFESLHDEYLRLYQLNPLFSEIFTNGNFNCITATVMYAVAFDRLGIPFEAKILPDHSYLVAYPKSENQIVETTNPLKGTSINFDSRDRYKSVQELIDYKLVSQQEVNEKGIDRVFSDNYLGVETVDLKQLIGALYLNAGFAEMANYNFPEAYNQLKKSSFLYPKKTTTAVLLLSLASSLEQHDYENPDYFQMLSEIERFLFMGIPENTITQEFLFFMEKKKGNNNMDEVDLAYTFLMDNLDSQEIKNDLGHSYYYNKAINAAQDVELTEAIACIQKSISFKPDDKNALQIHAELIIEQIRNTESLDTACHLIENYSTGYAYLNDNKSFVLIHQGAMLDLMHKKYLGGNISEAESLRQQFELKFPPGRIDSFQMKKYLAQVYSMAAMYFFSQRKKSAAKTVLTSGLKYVPDSYELQSKMDALK